MKEGESKGQGDRQTNIQTVQTFAIINLADALMSNSVTISQGQKYAQE